MENYYISQAQQNQVPVSTNNILIQPGTYIGLGTGIAVALFGAWLARRNIFANTRLSDELTREREKSKSLEEALTKVQEQAMSNTYTTELAGLRNDLSKYNLINSENAMKIANLPTREEFKRLDDKADNLGTKVDAGFKEIREQFKLLNEKLDK